MPRLRILHILWSLGVGGIEVWLKDALRVVDPREMTFDFLVFERTDLGLEDAVRSLGSSVMCVPPPRRTRWWGPQIAMAIRRNGPYDIAHCHFVARHFPLLWAGLAGVRTRFLHLHETSFGWPRPGALETAGLAVMRGRQESQGATCVVAVSRATARSWYADTAVDHRCGVLYGGISLEAYDKPLNRG